jgi:2-methylcitrate dehydratase PrpD
MPDFRKGHRRVVEFIHEFTLDDMPAAVRDQARTCLLDLIGACLAGSRAKGVSILTDFVREQMAGTPEATVIGTGRKTSCVSAALINGFIANALDIDDGHRICKGHPGSVIFPALLAAAERTRADGTALLEALVVGYETAIRAGSICYGHYDYFHGSGAWGALGAAAACARLLGLDADRTGHALGIAEGYAPLAPVMRSVAWPAMAPKDGVAWGAMVGISAALLAEEGYTGSPSLFGDPEHNDDIGTLGKIWRIMHLYFKPYPCCRWAQPSIDAVIGLMKTSGIALHEIRRIVIHTFAESAALSPETPTDI